MRRFLLFIFVSGVAVFLVTAVGLYFAFVTMKQVSTQMNESEQEVEVEAEVVEVDTELEAILPSVDQVEPGLDDDILLEGVVESGGTGTATGTATSTPIIIE